MTETIVIVGANLAGGRAAESLRKLGFEGRIVLVGAEKDRPYDRPPLSKKAMRGQMPEEKLFFRPLEYYDEHRIELHLGVRAERLDGTSREVELSSGTKIGFDKLLVATGADVRRLTCEGATLPGIHYLRSLEDARGIRAELAPGKRLVVIGAGVIGMEVAASCREEGCEVTVLEMLEVPLLRAFGRDVGALYGQFHRERGVDVRCGVGVASFRGGDRVEEVVTTTGEVIPCDFVVAGIGVVPATGWLEGSGVALDRGVLVNERCETSLPGVYAAGDVARFFHTRLGRHVMIESVENAQLMAATAVANMMGKSETHAPVAWFWSDQYELKLQSVGAVDDYDRVVYRGSIADKQFAAFLVKGDRVTGVLGVNRLKEIAAAKKLISASIPVVDAMLADADLPMSKVLAGPTPAS
ncbi:MAG: FAD-dependent oxidoreductase [Sandaracinaceae bacterium]|nr:FAD-dependent oxidoreductase [Sandaracinaceae bacterium]